MTLTRAQPDRISVDEYKRLYVDHPRVQQPTRGKMNRVEAAYAAHLELRKLAGEIVNYKYESVKLRLADRCWLTVDFVVAFPDGTSELHETKGRKDERYYAREDSKIKARVCAEQYPWWPFRIVWPLTAAMQTWGREEL